MRRATASGLAVVRQGPAGSRVAQVLPPTSARPIQRSGCSNFSPALPSISPIRMGKKSGNYKYSRTIPSNILSISTAVTSSPSTATWTTSRNFRSSTIPRDVVPFLLTDVGEGIMECEVLEWKVKVGDKIDEFDAVCVLQSDKATVEVTSRFKGNVTKIYYKVGDLAKVGQPLIDIDTGHVETTVVAGIGPTAPTTATPIASSTSPATSMSTSPVLKGDAPVLTTPAVRRIAKENGIDLRMVAASGRDGRVLKEDVLAFLEQKRAPTPSYSTQPVTSQKVAAQPTIPTTSTATSTATATSPTATAKAPTPTPSPPRPIYVAGEDKEVEIRGLQRTMVKTMTQSNSIPHFGYCDEVEMDALVLLREELKALAEQRGVKLSYMPFILKATSLALKQHPALNSSVNSEVTKIIYKASHNLGIAMDTPYGLYVPNIKNVQSLSVFEIAQELNRLHKLGIDGKLGKEDLTSGTFSLSNIGSIGGTYAKPVVLAPEVAIGALGKIQRLPRFASARGSDSERVVAKRIMVVSWSADHRVIDGATMANFSNLWKNYLENPKTMLLDTR